MSDIRLDWAREARTGVVEAIWCASKSDHQISDILREADQLQKSLLLTRLAPEMRERLGHTLDYDPVSRTAILDHGLPALVDRGVAIVAAGTSDATVAHEARRTLEFHGIAAPTHVDVGVAGLWRLTDLADQLKDSRVIIAVAGFEGAIFSVLAGLIAAPVIAVPTSVGTGVAEGGRAALSTALATCAPGVLTVNIDNGFGAAAAVCKILLAGQHLD